jgi:hypothetical protein
MSRVSGTTFPAKRYKDGCYDNDVSTLQQTNDPRRALPVLQKARRAGTDHARTAGDGSRTALWHECHVAALGLYRRHVLGDWDCLLNVDKLLVTIMNGKSRHLLR